MRNWIHLGVGLLGMLLLAGCRTATRVADVPRVDLDLSEGNRGYLVGKAPESAEGKTTRQMVQTDIEIPSLYKPHHNTAPLNIENVTLPETAPAETPAVSAPAASSTTSGTFDTYVVKKGESLWTIAAKPEVYGKATRWRQLFEANQDLLKGNPDRLRAGMTIKIPRDSGARETRPRDEGTSFKK